MPRKKKADPLRFFSWVMHTRSMKRRSLTGLSGVAGAILIMSDMRPADDPLTLAALMTLPMLAKLAATFVGIGALSEQSAK